MLIAIDGPAASGKGTVAKMIAEHFGLEYLDTGRLYRLVGFEVLSRAEELKNNRTEDEDLNTVTELLQSMIPIEVAKALNISNINSPELETEEVGRAASIVSAIPEVRAALLEFQQNIANSPKGAVLDGRDIGTVIAPHADFKFYITAIPEARANRRFNQLQQRQPGINEGDILHDIIQRDKRDSERSIAPLTAAADAIYIDTSNMSIAEVFEKVRSQIERGV